MATIFLSILAFILVWNLIPNLIILTLPIPAEDKRNAIKCFMFDSFPKGLLALIPNMLAPVVVPFALLFTKWEDDKLPSLFWWFDNDVTINGDRFPWKVDPATGQGVKMPIPVEDTPEARELCYWAPGHHPRSFYARYIWLGWRNRASKLSQHLGYKFTPEEMAQVHDHFGDPETGRTKSGWVVYKFKGIYQLYYVKQLGRICIRINYGFKIWKGPLSVDTSMVINISFSLISWKGN